jgi:hypothetical protein
MLPTSVCPKYFVQCLQMISPYDRLDMIPNLISILCAERLASTYISEGIIPLTQVHISRHQYHFMICVKENCIFLIPQGMIMLESCPATPCHIHHHSLG